ncbi:heterogeneous nuclear ribonucleoprotein K isoform X1 [Cataglyphis hispanica]|uniref:heterogeneous nuclear ribonucleoprotein K isoform X1 n=1 Tax=Cataglyphis hispanica TaxID=1086592 RepID=UPI00217F9426|nr:heterogeneous nuclear ribonucleoprotein K isoform X1 [Cataglyphis hispanica]XP_050456160.1 heterogeneous nuclear ribonucleoprotein K isoform X1 [Cataglyphis hispanica]XP_050456161.1 heterogeneous nuclear ribonucleoprotein K isoform X1 [Cataglyphis hispanica]XP_050456162.1 heterogeneous nuclear ribonucleoprotein K isoform X1 [Cataglyphis hispanica]XP_050456163.1 heterogeneous nuclear ribonucleoprotein K isoform X1 [Cataglyphis hispanica]XP_050456164.1 heterogeneous nuclear ribonucleoprotein 
MKREAEAGAMTGSGGPTSPHKRYRQGDDELRLLIPSKVAGSIIGKGGQNITKLRSQYKASIIVPDCPGPERVLTISSDLPTVLQVLNEVVPNLEETRFQNGSRHGSDEIDVRMLVHQSQAGCIIGKGGLKIKELREKTGARIKIYSNTCPRSTDRLISICGKPTTCIECIRELIATIKTSPLKGVNNPYDPHNFDDYYADDYGGYGNADGNQGKVGGFGGPGGRGAGGGGGGGNSAGAGGNAGSGMPPRRDNRGSGPGDMNRGFPPPSRGGPRGNSGGGMSGGPPDRGYGGNSRVGNSGGGGGYDGGRAGGGYGGNRGGPPPYASGNYNGDGWGMQGGAPNGLGGGGNLGMSGGPPMGGNNQGNQGNMSGNKTSTQVTIPKDLAGAIIGKGGARIRKIRSDSGAGITIDEPLPGSNDRIITITGIPNQIQMAQYLLQQSVHENADHY